MITAPTHGNLNADPADLARREHSERASAAAKRLEEVFTAAGLPRRPVMDHESLVISLPSMTSDQALTMVSVMCESMRRDFAAAELLNAAGRQLRIAFQARVARRRVEVADLTIYEADFLATLLGRPTPNDVDPDDLDDPQTAEAVVDRLQQAIKSATGIRVGMDLLPACFCSSCGHPAAVRFLPMDKRTAKRLGKSLSTLGSAAGRTATEGTV